MSIDAKGRKIYPAVEARQLQAKRRCGICGGGLLLEATLDAKGALDFSRLSVFCQFHPTTGKFVSKYAPRTPA